MEIFSSTCLRIHWETNVANLTSLRNKNLIRDFGFRIRVERLKKFTYNLFQFIIKTCTQAYILFVFKKQQTQS